MSFDTWNAREGVWGEDSHYTFHEILGNFVLMLLTYRSAGDAGYLPLTEREHGNFLSKAGRFLIASLWIGSPPWSPIPPTRDNSCLSKSLTRPKRATLSRSTSETLEISSLVG